MGRSGLQVADDVRSIAGEVEHQWRAIARGLQGGLTQVSARERGLTAVCDGRLVNVEYALGDPGGWLVVRTPVCARGAMDPELTLERNDTLAFAALQLSKGTYWLRLGVPFDSAEMGDPLRWIKRVVAAARSLSPHHVAVNGAHEIFSRYAE